MASEFSSGVDYDVLSTRYPAPEAEWARMSFSERLNEKVFGGSTIRGVIRKFAPDVVYSDSPLYASQFKLASLLYRKRTPLVLHLRGDLWREHNAALASISVGKRVLLMQQQFYDWAAVALAEKITPICGWLQGVVRRHVPWKRSEVVYQGVDPNEFWLEEGFEVQKPAVAIVQNHSVYPKVQGLLNFSGVVTRLPQVHFYIAEGEAGTQQFLDLVKDRYARFNNVHFVGDVTNVGAVRRMLTACDIYILASGLDCCPTTVLEASLLERPILASRVGGVPELISNGHTGWCINNSDADDWVKKIQMLIEDPEQGRRLGRQGREWVSKKFGWSTIAPQVERIINEEAEKRR